MAQRRFGPTLGAGVVLIEQEAQKLIEPAPLGVTFYVTPLEKGSTTDPISTFSKRDMIRKVGGLISGFDGPDCAQDFWDHSNGAGELHFLRVCKSTARAAALDVFSREMTAALDNFTAGKARAIVRVTAKSPGRWANRKRVIWRLTTLLADIGATTLTTGLTMLQDEWVDGVVILDGVPTKEYAITANSSAGVVSVSSDANMAADLAGGGSPTDQGYQLVLRYLTGPEGLKRTLAVEFENGETKPDTEFALNVYVNEELVRRYPNLSMDPASANYFVRLINDDQGNYEITVSDLMTPANPAPSDRRPANESGLIGAITTTTLTSKLIQGRRTVGISNPTITLGATTDVMRYRDTLIFEVTAGGGTATISMKSRRLGNDTEVHAPVTASNTNSTPFAFTSPASPLIPPITLTCGATVFTVGDKFEVDYFPFEPSALAGGTLCPDFINKPRNRYRILSNDHKTITIQSGDLITDGGGAIDDRFMAFYRQDLGGPDRVGAGAGLAVAQNGYDGLAGLSDADYTTTHLNTVASRARDLLTQNKGLVKLATPDRSATSVVKAGLQLAEALNWQFRVEIPDTVVSEDAAIAQINDTIGRSDFGVTSLPSYGDVNDLQKPGQLKRIPLTGMIHGREAKIAKDWDGYHKAAAGIEVTLPRLVQSPISAPLNEEALNPQGINVIKKVKGNWILWGDRTISIDSAWKWKHQRELMSHYENRLREGFDFVIFAINDPIERTNLISTLRGFFLPEFAKRAVRGKDFADAVRIKIDAENNTDATAAAGDLFCDLSLRLADTVERFIIRIGKTGIFDSVSA